VLVLRAALVVALAATLTLSASAPGAAAPRRGTPPAGPSTAAAPSPSEPGPPAGRAPEASVLTAPAPTPEAGPGALGLLGLALGLAGALAALAWALGRWPRAARWLGREGPVRVLARAALGPRQSLCLVEALGVGALVALHPAGVTVVHVWPAGLPAAAEGPGAPSHAQAPPTARPPRQLAALVEALRRREAAR